ncbi:MAG: ATP-binding protein [Roseiflexaceae bacterium]|nr:ATP-binding protein [Roseiflexaceae bacterium]
MELLTTILAIALGASLWWGFRLQRRLATMPLSLPPQPESHKPLFDAATAAFDAGLIVLDEERRVRYLNSQAEELLGVAGVGKIGQGLITLVRDYQVDSLASDVLSDGEPRELVMQPASYGRTLRLRVTRFTGDGLIGAVVLIRDVTQLNMLERARRDMVANVSHELRTPLASVKLLVETVQSDPPPAIAQRMLSQMAQEIDSITQLVNELHELSQIESGRVALQLIPTKLAPIVERAIERIRPQAERKSLHVAAEVDPTLPMVLMDADRVGQVLLNLLHNAAKFTQEGGTVTIRAVQVVVTGEMRQTGYIERRSRNERIIGDQERRSASVQLSSQGRPEIQVPSGHATGEWMLISIHDNGVGIPSPDLPRIFERFYKVDRARTRNAGGTGLGLAIAKHLIEGHGGRIWATSREGQGSTFFFTLPVA